jgi:hypothetical protein
MDTQYRALTATRFLDRPDRSKSPHQLRYAGIFYTIPRRIKSYCLAYYGHHDFLSQYGWKQTSEGNSDE